MNTNPFIIHISHLCDNSYNSKTRYARKGIMQEIYDMQIVLYSMSQAYDTNIV